MHISLTAQSTGSDSNVKLLQCESQASPAMLTYERKGLLHASLASAGCALAACRKHTRSW